MEDIATALEVSPAWIVYGARDGGIDFEAVRLQAFRDGAPAALRFMTEILDQMRTVADTLPLAADLRAEWRRIVDVRFPWEFAASDRAVAEPAPTPPKPIAPPAAPAKPARRRR